MCFRPHPLVPLLLTQQQPSSLPLLPPQPAPLLSAPPLPSSPGVCAWITAPSSGAPGEEVQRGDDEKRSDGATTGVRATHREAGTGSRLN
ncbi:unnamed protein product [Pleuronectes platessa]|uniref:Uncharacterized protein n=1 Tax=Pleuronectes platessa TaxID=8262 RepID=A0A9N7TQ51_PLEPL|nr:unnamed protein product [Pleuronectes platessa]